MDSDFDEATKPTWRHQPLVQTPQGEVGFVAFFLAKRPGCVFYSRQQKETMNPEKRRYSAAAVSAEFCVNPEPEAAPSPVTSQLNTLRTQLDDLDHLVGRLIDSTRSILSGDPRHEPICQSPDQVFSCPLEQDLSILSERVGGLQGVLSRTLKNIQL